MPLLADRVLESSITAGTGTLTLAGALTGYRTFNSAFSNGNIVYYTIDDGLGDYEVGYGTVGTGTLTRSTVLESSNANALVVFTSVSKRVFCTAPVPALLPDQTGNSTKILSTDGSNPSWIANTVGTVTSVGGTGTVNGITLTGTVTTSGAITLGGTLSGVSLTTQVSGTLPVLNGGTGVTTSTGTGSVVLSASPTFTGTTTVSGQLNLTNASNYNLYASGAGNNYMAGSLGIGATPVAGYKVLNSGNWTGATTFFGCASQGTIQSDVTAAVYSYRSAPNTAAASFTLSNLIHYIAEGSAVIGAGSAITTQQGHSAASNLTTATNNYGFYGAIASGTGRYNLYMTGTANNYMAGNVGIGITTPAQKLSVAGTIESTTGGVKFPDGTTQTTAATAGVTTGKAIAMAMIFGG
jgi:hypothetical protein